MRTQSIETPLLYDRCASYSRLRL